MKPLGGIFSVGVEEQYRWKDSVQTEAEIRTWVAEGVANGMRPWFTKFSGVLYDKRWLGTVEKIYQVLYRNENYLRNISPLARVGLVFSEHTGNYGNEKWQRRTEDHSSGMYHALIEARIPFGNTIRWALNEEPIVEVAGAGVIDVAAWRQEKSMTVHLVNLTNPMMMKGPFRELIPISAEATVRIPENLKVYGVHLLVSDQKIPFEPGSGKITVTIPQIFDHEIIGIDFK